MLVTDYDTVSERAAIATALLAGSADLAAERSVRDVLIGLADLLVAASPHLRLAWIFIGDREAETICADYAVGPEADYGRSLSIDRSGLMMRGPVRCALARDEMVIQRIPEKIGLIGLLDPGVRRWHRKAMNADVKSVMAYPFHLLGEGEFALTVLYADRQNYFEDIGTQAFQAVGRLAGLSIERAQLRDRAAADEAQLTRLSLYDPLTGLVNRAYFHERLDQLLQKSAKAKRWPVAIALLDLDDFADLNRHLGSAAGDSVLQQVGHRLRAAIPEEGFLARLANDTFAFAWEVRTDTESAIEEILAACLASVRMSMRLASRTVEITASIGGVVCPLAAQIDSAALVQCAETALGLVRRDGGNGWSIGEFDCDARSPGRHVLMQDVKLALESDQFTLVYQPIARLDGSRAAPLKVEALLRWRHPRRGWVAPDEFIPLVERSGFIRDIGCWVLAQALRDAAAWHRHGIKIAVSVNIGARHLLSPDFQEDLRRIMAEATMAVPLAIEITETAALSDLAGAGQILKACRAMGVDVALDDFGTGYTSWRYLEQLPVTQLKIDRSYVQRLCERPEDLAIVAGAVTSARLLGLEVIAEGVETTEQGLMASRIGCHYAQGYLISRPMAAADLPQWAAAWQLPSAWQRQGGRAVPQGLALLFAITSHRREAREWSESPFEPAPTDGRQCALNGWLNAEGADLLPARRLDTLCQLHERFHQAVGSLRANGCQSAGPDQIALSLQHLTEAADALVRELHAAYGVLCAGAENLPHRVARAH